MSPLGLHYLSHAAIPSSEANSIQVMKMCAAFARRGHDVTLYCRGGGAAAHAHYGVEPSFRIVGLARRRLPLVGRLAYALDVLARIRRVGGAALLYGRDFHTLALVALTGRPALPIVLEVHQPPRNALEHWLQRLVLASPRFQRLVVISQALEQEYLRRFGTLLRGRVTVAHDGADAPGPDGVRAATEAPSPAPLRLGYVGNLYPGKGMELIASLARRLPDVRFEVIGGSGQELEAWRARLASAGIRNIALRGQVPHREALAAMQACDVLLAPYQRSVWIGEAASDVGRWMSPLKVFEYMASGRAMIASDLPVLREVLEDGANALLADPDDLEAWVRAVRALEASPAMRQALAARARADLERSYTWARRAELVLAASPALAEAGVSSLESGGHGGAG